MTVCMDLHKQENYLAAWRNLWDHVEHLIPYGEPGFRQLAQAELDRYEGWTDWDDDEDPIWFVDVDHLTQFVLTWS